jgi:hypothetical protein
MWDEAGQLYGYHGDVPVEVRLLKLTEEAGEWLRPSSASAA